MPGTGDLPQLTGEERLRYGRHLVLPEVGEEGQRRLKQARVLLVGAGGLGSPAALYLAAAGVGHLGLVDFDAVDASNLQRQVIHGTRDVGRPKVDSARDRIADLNPNVHLEPYPVRLGRGNALELVGAHDLVVDGTDNFATRYLVNDACVLAGRPNVYASIFRFEGQASIFATADGPCYRCLHPEPPPPGLVPSCAEGGVLGVLPGLLGLIQATEALKLLLGIGQPLVGRLLLVDALHMDFQAVKLKRDPRCPACGTRTLRELADYEALCAGPAAAGGHRDVAEYTPRELAALLSAGASLELVDVRERHEWAVSRLPGARLAPLSELDDHLAGLPRDRDLVLYCRVGQRSATAARRLLEAGFTRVWHLAGGLARWSAELGPPPPG
jgi:molybdopterin/thiamine biosynthesis adenylyltransferase/rhodanese-related sulfurtransferase